MYTYIFDNASNWTSLKFLLVDCRNTIALHPDGLDRSSISLYTVRVYEWITRAIGSPEGGKRDCALPKISVARKAFCFAYTCQTRCSPVSPSHSHPASTPLPF